MGLFGALIGLTLAAGLMAAMSLALNRAPLPQSRTRTQRPEPNQNYKDGFNNGSASSAAAEIKPFRRPD